MYFVVGVAVWNKNVFLQHFGEVYKILIIARASQPLDSCSLQTTPQVFEQIGTVEHNESFANHSCSRYLKL